MAKHWIILILLAIIIILSGLIYVSTTQWGKTMWDWVELLVVPAALALIAVWFNAQGGKDDREAAELRAKIDRAIATDRLQEAALQAYYDKMTELLLKEDLRNAPPDSEVISIALSRTRATLRALDHIRKGFLVEFLRGSHLIDKQNPIITLDGADLTGAEMVGIVLSEANLSGANLTGGMLSAINLSKAKLSGADLSSADLREADLSSTNLTHVQLAGANLSEAILNKTNLSGADLTKANLLKADLKDAILKDTVLDDTQLNTATSLELSQLARAASLNGTILPDGKRYQPVTHPEINRLRQEAGLPPFVSPVKSAKKRSLKSMIHLPKWSHTHDQP